MLVFDDIQALKSYIRSAKSEKKSIGLVPTMGALHQGHLSLIERSASENDITICSIYVNPVQFNNSADLKKYPRTIEDDKQLLSVVDDVHIFLPSNQIMYPEAPKLKFNFGDLEEVMEGAFRPGHFHGVALVVSKLFHLVSPDRAYFGQKDLQQCMIVKQMVKDLSFDLELIICPTQREADGLAMSSRNKRLNETHRKEATGLSKVLFMAKELIEKGEKDFDLIKSEVIKTLSKTQIKLEYFQIVSKDSLQELKERKENEAIALCIAAYVGEVRLIDNLIIS